MAAVAIASLSACTESVLMEDVQEVQTEEVNDTLEASWKLSSAGDTIICRVEVGEKQIRIPVMISRVNSDKEKYTSLEDIFTLDLSDEISAEGVSCSPLVECEFSVDILCRIPLDNSLDNLVSSDYKEFCREITITYKGMAFKQKIYFFCSASAERGIPWAFVSSGVRALIYDDAHQSVTWATVKRSFYVEDYMNLYLFH